MARFSITLIVIAFLAGCSSTQNDNLVAKDVPGNALVSVQKTVDFMQIESVELVSDGSAKLYKIKGSDLGVHYEVAVTESGEIVEIEETPVYVDMSEATFSE